MKCSRMINCSEFRPERKINLIVVEGVISMKYDM